MAFTKEADFEAALIKILSEHGWEKEVLHNYTEQQLIKNWADIVFLHVPVRAVRLTIIAL